MSDESVLVKDLPVEQNPGETDRTMIIDEDGRPRISTLGKIKSVIGNDPRVGELSNLKTANKTTLVAAINELFDMIQALANPVVSISAQVQKGGLFIAPGDDYDTLSLYLTVTATYANGSRQEVRGYTLSGPDGHFVAGDNTITVTYQTKQTTVSVYIDEW